MRDVVIRFTDDLDWESEATETVLLSLNRKEIELDLSAEHFAELKGKLQVYFEAAEKVKQRKKNSSLPAGNSRAQSIVYNNALRDWAEARGTPVEKSDSPGASWYYPRKLRAEFEQALLDGTASLPVSSNGQNGG
jgi:Lsr2